ncbi:MAG: cobyric acid synthase [Candidatus Electronema sp. V4]|uniref:cobyric acid synthase n=1 Tax=Candidatus Electronema sp. V4 TaxID=3454756 RepID=UPI0040555EB4
MKNTHGGNLHDLAARCGCKPDDILDFSANINPLGPPEQLWHVLAARMQDIVHYPDPDASELIKAISNRHRIFSTQIIVGNGTSELLHAAVRALRPQRAVIPVPAYVDYRHACVKAGIKVLPVQLPEEKDFQPDLRALYGILRPGDLLILGQPNNPTGRMCDRNKLLALADRCPETLFLIDEAFAGFVEGYESVACCRENIITLCSLTKLYAVPGLRLGLLAASEQHCATIRSQIAPWAVNTLAQAAGAFVLGEDDYLRQSRETVRRCREMLCRELAEHVPQVRVIEGAANFLLLRLNVRTDAAKLAEKLLRDFRIAIRACADYEGLDRQYFRIAVRSEEENSRLVNAMRLTLALGSAVASIGKKKRTPALMLLGTGSDVGKSVLAAGLCRVLLQDGLRVAPFKAQNMSLNSCVTKDGLEMGRAQAVQAQACFLDPDARMNPVLLKPNSDVGSQVIVLGKPVGNMRVAEYVRYKEQLWRTVCATYDELAAEHDCMILEGAGSPGEVNLKAHDIVNMRMARHAQAPVLLVGDIDRGGVYASFVGHVEVMAPWERRLLAGFIVNRFRGDASLLADAHRFLEQRTGRPVFGVVPWLPDLGLPQEDSVSFKAGIYDRPKPVGPHVEIALIDLPHISNFTDLEPLLAEPDVWLRTVRRAEDLGTPDCVILPGSKNVPADLAWLKEHGLTEAVRRLAEAGAEIIGICGGFQMLGRSVADPHGLEGGTGSISDGLGLLDLSTELAAEKTLIRRQGLHLPSGLPVRGYEIHHGLSQTGAERLLAFEDGGICGCADASGKIWGSYLHGIFDSDSFRRWLLNRLSLRKGLAALDSSAGARYDIEPALDRLADVLRQQLDMEGIRRLLGG